MAKKGKVKKKKRNQGESLSDRGERESELTKRRDDKYCTKIMITYSRCE